MKVLILGAGAIGTLLGARLSRHSRVCLYSIDREHIDHIKKKGAKIEELSGEITCYRDIEAAVSPEEIPFTPDLVLITLKTYSLEKGLQSLKGNYSSSTIFLTVQNGIGNIEKIAKFLSPRQIMAGVTAQGATLIRGGLIKHGGNGPTYIGELDGKITSRLKTIVQLFNNSHLPCELSQNIEMLIWKKLLINIGINAITALLGFSNMYISKNKWAKTVAQGAVEEAYKVCIKKGIKLEQDIFSLVEEVSVQTGQNISSMYQDILNKKPTEIEAINGAIVREGERVGVDTPINWTLTHLIRALEQKHKEINHG